VVAPALAVVLALLLLAVVAWIEQLIEKGAE
jgi:hypothetical protein